MKVKNYPVTRPFLPPLDDYKSQVDAIFASGWLTNDGSCVNALEEKLQSKLALPQVNLVSSGTIALHLAIRALNLSGEILTTAFSYIATTSSIYWSGCRPVFVDIESHGYNIDLEDLERKITPRTSAILATHCFGVPCDVAGIQRIAEHHGLKVIYDGAHAFGTVVNGQSVFHWGDVSTCSFHATKLFHSVEGGMVVARSAEVAERVRRLRNFGHNGEEKFSEFGTNGKNSELHAAMGLSILPHVDEILEQRRMQAETYHEVLFKAPLRLPPVNNPTWNCAYFPIVFEDEQRCIAVKTELAERGILTRRYFYPSLNRIATDSPESCPRAESLSERILCLPMFHELTQKETVTIGRLIVSLCSTSSAAQ